MGIPDRIILTLYTFLMAVVAVLVTLCSLDVFPQRMITEFIGSNGYPMTIVVDKAGVITMIEYGTSPTQRTKLKEEIRKLIEQ